MVLCVRQMKVLWKNSSTGNKERAVGKKLSAICPDTRVCISYGLQVQTRLWVSIVQIVSSEQTMTLGSYVSYFQLHVSGELALDRKVILRRILRAHMRL